MSIVSVLIALVVFFVIILLHELGHFAVAKLCGVKVNEFSIGMGPLLLKKQKGDTQYSLRLLPIGGYCAMEGEDKESTDPKAFNRKPVWKRMAIVVAGAVMNLILGFVLIMVTTILYGDICTLQVAGFATDKETGASVSTSETCGLQVDDVILSINGMRILTDTDLSYMLQTEDTSDMTLVVRRNGEKVTLEHVKFCNTATQGCFDFYVKAVPLDPLNTIRYSFLGTISTGRLIWSSLHSLITGRFGLQDMSGPIGIVSTIGDAASAGKTFRESLVNGLNLASFITINIGIFNLLPIPALDGARLVFLLVEAIRRKPVPPEMEGMVHLAGMALLILLMVVVSYQDIVRLF